MTREVREQASRRPVESGLLAGLILLAVAGWAVAGGVDAMILPYQEARAAGRLGSLEARALADPARPSLPPTPVAGVTVALLPWTAEVEARLEAVKASSRSSMKTYLASVSGIRGVLAAWEQDLTAGGGQDLMRQATTDSAGTVRFADVPAGDWLLVAWRVETKRAERTVKPRRDDAKFVGAPESTGYTLVTFWRSKLAVLPGQAAETALTDRGVWLSGVETETRPPAPSPIGTGPRKHR